MSRAGKINDKEKKILNILGKRPNVSVKELLVATGYKWPSTISQKLDKFEKLGYLRRGPYYDINLSAVGENQLYFVYGDIRFPSRNRDIVLESIKIIECWRWIYPTIDANRFFVLFQVNHFNQIGKLLSILKDADMISYELFASRNRWIIRNPDFFGDEIPLLEDPDVSIDPPDLSYPELHLSIRWREIDLRLMQYLQIFTDNLRLIQKKEYQDFSNFWKYHQLKHSYRKIMESGIVTSTSHHLRPYPIDECSTLLLIIESENTDLVLYLMDQFAQKGRIHKSFSRAGKTGLMFLWASPKFMLNLLKYFDEFRDLEVRVAPLRTHNSRYLAKQSFHAEHFDIETQRWTFPYAQYEEKIEELIQRSC
jgi:DNA-binding Lrp family transcriptional regulator